MTKSKSVFKRRKCKGNQHFRTHSVVEPNSQTEQSSPTESRPNSTTPSSSKKKLSATENKYSDIVNSDSVNIIINLDILSSVIREIASCNLCGGQIILSENIEKRNGLVSSLNIECMNCKMCKQFYTSDKCTNNDLFEINVRYFYGLRCIGKGFAAGKMLSGVLNIATPPTSISKYTNVVGEAVREMAENSMKNAVSEAVAENEGSTDIAVGFDGTWQKRGFKSNNGVASATSIDTGKILDVDILSKYCQGCTLLKKKGAKDHAGECRKNYEGTSGGMEAAAAVTIFQRSLEKHGVRYSNFLGDGDSKAYKAVCDSKPYGDFQIEKLECVGHVQKRLGKQLRNLKQNLGKTKLSDGKTIRGRLTDSTIDKFQSYYGKAIRDNNHNLEEMMKAVWATLFHSASSDEKPLHSLCSINWCKYLKAEAAGTLDKFKHKRPLDKAIVLAIKPVYHNLAHSTLLSKCLHGKTQNVNESFNQLIWTRVPKTVFVGRKTLELGVYDAVLGFNEGNIGRINVLKSLGVKIGQNTATIFKQLDDLRVMKSELAMENMTKEARTKRRRARLQENDAEEDEDYIPGGF